MNRFVAMIKEPSTWAGLSILAGLFGVPVATIPLLAKAGMAVGAAAAVLLPEGGSK